MNYTQKQFENIRHEFDAMLQTGTLPCFEFEMVDNEFLLVEIGISEKGVLFSFDTDNKPVYFDGGIEQAEADNDNLFIVPFCEYVEDWNLDSFLEFIYRDIVEGFLIPNNLYV